MSGNAILGASSFAVGASLALLVAPGPVPAAKEAAFAEVSPRFVLSGTDGHIREREYHCVRDARAWAALWRRSRGIGERHWQSRDYDRWIVGLPDIDFSKYIVIAVFKGENTLTGVRGEWITLEKECLRFRFLAAWQRDPMLPQPSLESPTEKPAPPPPSLGIDPSADPAPYDEFVFPRTDRLVVIEEMQKDGKTGAWTYVPRTG